MVCVPIAAVIVAITVIGIPLALVGLLLFGAALRVACAVSGLAVGPWGVQRWCAADAGRLGWRPAASALGVLTVALMGRLPFVGGLVAWLAVCAGLGFVHGALVANDAAAAVPCSRSSRTRPRR